MKTTAKSQPFWNVVATPKRSPSSRPGSAAPRRTVARTSRATTASTVSITRYWPLALSLLLAACHDPQGSTIRSAAREGDRLVLDLDLRFTDNQLQALDHGIPLRLAVQIDGAADAFVDLRYRPLPRQYELRLPNDAAPRVFASRARLIAALDRIVITGFSATSGSVRVALVSSALPAPLRLPALIDREWQLATPSRDWGR